MRAVAGNVPEIEIGKIYVLKRTGEQVRVTRKAFTLDAEKWNIDSVATGNHLFPVSASGLEELATT